MPATQYHDAMHTTTELSNLLGVNVQTIRRWSIQYAQYMSAESRTGDQRIYTDDDLLVLWSARRWRQLGYSLDDIGERLGKGERASEPPPQPQSTDEPPRAIMVTDAVYTAALAEVRRLEGEQQRLLIERDSAMGKNEALNEKIGGLEREIGELRGKLAVIEIERIPTRRWLVILAAAVTAAFLVAVVITAALLLLAR